MHINNLPNPVVNSNNADGIKSEPKSGNELFSVSLPSSLFDLPEARAEKKSSAEKIENEKCGPRETKAFEKKLEGAFGKQTALEFAMQIQGE